MSELPFTELNVIFFLSALMAQLNYIHIKIRDRFMFCAVGTTVLYVSTQSSSWFIISMTFERFYSIIRPHKAASVNTVKKAKIIIVSILFLSTICSIPMLFLTTPDGNICVVYVRGMDHLAAKMYYWADQVVGFIFPFIALLTMNTVIIHTLRKRSTLLLTRSETLDEGQGQNQGHSSKMKSSEKQIIINVASCDIWVLDFNDSNLWHDILFCLYRFQYFS